MDLMYREDTHATLILMAQIKRQSIIMGERERWGCQGGWRLGELSWLLLSINVNFSMLSLDAVDMCRLRFDDLQINDENITIIWETGTICTVSSETILNVKVCNYKDQIPVFKTITVNFSENKERGEVNLPSSICGTECLIQFRVMENSTILNGYDPCIHVCTSLYKCRSKSGMYNNKSL